MRFPLANPPYDEKVQQIFDKVDLGPLAPQNFLRVLAHQPRLLGNIVALGGFLPPEDATGTSFVPNGPKTGTITISEPA